MLSLKLRWHSVFSRNRGAHWVLFTVSWYLSLCSQISRNGYEFISVGRVKEHKIAQQRSLYVKVVEQRPTCLPAFPSTSSVWNLLWKRHLHNEEPMLSALACGMHVRVAVSSFEDKTGAGLLWPRTWLLFTLAPVIDSAWHSSTFKVFSTNYFYAPADCKPN